MIDILIALTFCGLGAWCAVLHDENRRLRGDNHDLRVRIRSVENQLRAHVCPNPKARWIVGPRR